MTNTLTTTHSEVDYGVGIWHSKEWHYFFYETEADSKVAELLLRAIFNPSGDEVGRLTRCKDDNHKLNAESWAGTESGGEHIYCTRCDWSQMNTYY